MERVDIPIPQDQDDRAKRIESLQKDSRVLALLEEKEIPVSTITRYPARFESYLSEQEVCQACKGIETCRQKRQGYRISLSYDGVLQENLEACPYMIDRLANRKHLDAYLVNDMGQEILEVKFEGIDFTNEDRSYVNALMTAMNACHSNQGLYLYGNMGTGKTYLSACAANYMARQGKKVAFVRCASFMERMRSQVRENEYRTEMQRLMYADFVVFDDIGAEEFNERTRSILLSILDHRLQNHLTTWFTSNHDFKTLQQHYVLGYDGNNHLDAMRIVERIRALTQPLEIIGNDRRSLAKLQ